MGILDRFFGKKPPPPPPPVLSEESLRAAFGEQNVKYATCIAVDVVDPEMVVGGRDQIGGVPANIGADRWPRCAECKTPMTFIGQVACGPDELVRYSARGSVAIFLCNSEPPTIGQLCETHDGDGYSDVFFVEEGAAASPMFDEKQLHAIAQAQRANKRYSMERGVHPKQFLLPALDGFRGRPVLGNAFRVERRATLSCNTPPTNEAAELHYTFSEQHPELYPPVAIEIDTFPMWVQGGIEDATCTCGAPMELLLQFDAFDDAINLGDAGRAYVLACEKRCGPRSFTLRWTCC